MATICWASTSSGWRGTRVCSISPSRMRPATTAVSSRSPRNLGKKRPSDGVAHLVAGAADPLQAGGDRLGRLDLHDQVDAPMSMPSSSDEVATSAGSRPGLQQILDLEPLLAGERAVVGAGDVWPRASSFRRWATPLGRAAAVDEDDRRAVRAGPARAGAGRSPARSRRRGSPSTLRRRRRARACRRPARSPRGRAACRAGVDDGDRRGSPRRRGTGDLLERPLRGREADRAATARPAEVLEPLERERQVGAALGGGDRVDLVDDHRLDARRASRAAAEVSIR